MMAKWRTIVLGAVGSLLAVVLLLVAFNAEVRGMVLLAVAPKHFREAVFLRLANGAGEEVYLLGTIHGRHLTTEDYSLVHLQAVLHHLQPDLLLVESRPEELARDNWGDGPIEMPFVSLTARAAGIEVQGMDWWVLREGDHRTNSKAREDRMFQNILTHLPGHRKVLILTGFSHVEGFRQRFLANGFRQMPFSSAEKQALFDPSDQTFIFPCGMRYYIQKRIALDRATLQGVQDPWWRKRIADAIAFREALLDTIATVGEQEPCEFNRR